MSGRTFSGPGFRVHRKCFLHIWKAEVFYIKNPAGDILSPLSNLRNSRWRPRLLLVYEKQ